MFKYVSLFSSSIPIVFISSLCSLCWFFCWIKKYGLLADSWVFGRTNLPNIFVFSVFLSFCLFLHHLILFWARRVGMPWIIYWISWTPTHGRPNHFNFVTFYLQYILFYQLLYPDTSSIFMPPTSINNHSSLIYIYNFEPYVLVEWVFIIMFLLYPFLSSTSKKVEFPPSSSHYSIVPYTNIFNWSLLDNY